MRCGKARGSSEDEGRRDLGYVVQILQVPEAFQDGVYPLRAQNIFGQPAELLDDLRVGPGPYLGRPIVVVTARLTDYPFAALSRYRDARVVLWGLLLKGRGELHVFDNFNLLHERMQLWAR
jgi:hypothetical protein